MRLERLAHCPLRAHEVTEQLERALGLGRAHRQAEARIAGHLQGMARDALHVVRLQALVNVVEARRIDLTLTQ